MTNNPLYNSGFDLTGRVALVTGAAGLLGKEHSIALAQSGAMVVMTDYDQAKVKLAADDVRSLTGGDIRAFAMDVTNVGAIRAVQTELQTKGFTVTRLVNNAAIDPKVDSHGGISSSRLENFDEEQFMLEVQVGLTGAIQCASVFGPAMAKIKDGVILNIASDLSVFSPDQRIYRKNGLSNDAQPVKPVSYSVIKTALIGLTRYLATYWADHNVRSNALSPGGVYTSQDAEFVTRLCDLIPLGRMASREEYRGVVQFLCSDSARYLNGQNIVMDGGRSTL